MKAKQFQQAAQQATLTALPGLWGQVDQWGFVTGSLHQLKAQNGFWAQHKISHSTVFVVTTGPHKGIWSSVTHH